MALSEAFGFEQRWLRMLVKEIPLTPNLFEPGRMEHAQYVLGGLGNCQAKALRDWGRAMSFLDIQSLSMCRLTALANVVKDHDPSLEEDGTWWMIHAQLSSNPGDIWFYPYYANCFGVSKFTRRELRDKLQSYRSDSDSYVDKKCLFPLLHTMSATRLGNDFGILRRVDGVEFERTEPEIRRLPRAVVAFALSKWMQSQQRSTASVDELMAPGAPGRFLCLSRASLDEYLDGAHDCYGKRLLWVSRTAGLNSVAVAPDISPAAVLRAYYLEHLDGLSPLDALERAIEQETAGGKGNG